MGALLIYKLLP